MWYKNKMKIESIEYVQMLWKKIWFNKNIVRKKNKQNKNHFVNFLVT